VAYVGTAFHGWQRQRNAPRTVQAILEAALSRLDGRPVVVHAAGRTDSGVHADGQVAHFDLSRALAPDRLVEAVNAQLPWDVRLLDAQVAAPDFDARRDALWKEYLYRWSRAPVIPPWDSPFVVALSQRADLVRMRAEARHIAGERDFGVFGVRLPAGESSVRRVRFVRIVEQGEEIHAVVAGDGFLRGMVRSLCGVLADVARGKAPPGRIGELLRTQNRRLLSPKAPACGLTLLRVHYGRRSAE
jgi:tRNA pseudouridine38-40 synthase